MAPVRPWHVVGPPTDARTRQPRRTHANERARRRTAGTNENGNSRLFDRHNKVLSLLTSNCSSAQYIAPQMDDTRSEPSLLDNST